MSLKRPTKLAELPLSLIEFDILPRLPVKAVGRCMCVCKQWKSFLSTPMFFKEHRQYLIPTIDDYKALLLLDGTLTTLDGRCCNHSPADAKFVAGSVDGLVCLASLNDLAFWNPLTGAYKKLSRKPYVPSFNMDGPWQAFGFYVDSSNDYKIVHVVFGGTLGAYIYSHRLDSWREIVFPVELTVDGTWSEATICGNCVYFTVNLFTTEYANNAWSTIIICFDMNTEKFRKIRSPPAPPEKYADYSGSLVVLNGCIHLCASYVMYDDSKHSMHKHGHLWKMMDGDGWLKVAAYSDPMLFFIELQGEPRLVSEELPRQPICTVSTGNWLAVLEEENNSFKKMNTEDFTKQYGYFCSPNWEYRSRRIIYVETLATP